MIFRIAVIAVLALGIYAAYQAYVEFGTGEGAVSVDINPSQLGYGPEDAATRVTKYLDYSCEYCQKAHEPLLRAADNYEGGVRIVPRPLLSSNEEASTAARLLYAASILDAFQPAHDYLIKNFGPIDEVYLGNMAAAINVDKETLIGAYSLPETEEAVMLNMADFRETGSDRTPTFIINDQIVIPEDEDLSAAYFQNQFQQTERLIP